METQADTEQSSGTLLEAAGEAAGNRPAHSSDTAPCAGSNSIAASAAPHESACGQEQPSADDHNEIEPTSPSIFSCNIELETPCLDAGSLAANGDDQRSAGVPAVQHPVGEAIALDEDQRSVGVPAFQQTASLAAAPASLTPDRTARPEGPPDVNTAAEDVAARAAEAAAAAAAARATAASSSAVLDAAATMEDFNGRRSPTQDSFVTPSEASSSESKQDGEASRSRKSKSKGSPNSTIDGNTLAIDLKSMSSAFSGTSQDAGNLLTQAHDPGVSGSLPGNERCGSGDQALSGEQPAAACGSDNDSKGNKRLRPLRPPALTIKAAESTEVPDVPERSEKRSQSLGSGQMTSARTEPGLEEGDASHPVRSGTRSQTLQMGCVSTAPLPGSSQRDSPTPTSSRRLESLKVPFTPMTSPTSNSDSDSVPPTPTVLRHLVDGYNLEHVKQRSRANSVVSIDKVSNASGGRSRKKFERKDIETAKSMKRVRRTSIQIEGSALEATAEMLEKVLQDEKKRLKSKAVSRAYENDMRQVRMERDFLSKKDKDASKYSLKRRSANSKPRDNFSSLTPSLRRSDTFLEARNLYTMTSYLGIVGKIKWTATAIIALIIAMQAGIIILGAYYIGVWKVNVMAKLSVSSGPGLVYAWLFLLAYGLPAGFASSVLVSYVAPHAGGSGIPEIKSYLNGIASPQAFSFKTWVSRSIGLVLVTSAGLFAGTEGPFAHLGGIVASGMAEGPQCSRIPWPSILRGHRNRCEFISQGAAMGVAAAFGAPIGGILFSLEEASTFWSKTLTWQAFLGTMIAAVVAKLIKNGFTGLSGGGFIEFPDKNAGFEIWELFTFGIMACVMGLLGALFCALVKRCIGLRRSFFQLASPSPTTRKARVFEVLCVVTFSISICFWPSVFSGCVDLHPHDSGNDRHLMGSHTEGPPDLSGGICDDGSYSDVGYLLLQPKEAAIKALFSHNMQDGAVLKIPSLILCYAIIFGTTIITFGSAIPVGLFIPNILAGACFGRAVGQAFLEIGADIRPDVYALMGAAGALAGFSRMTISLAVIFVEITNNTYLGLPLMLTIMVSKMVADKFNPSVYDIVLELNPDIHLLEDNMSEDHLLVLESLTAHDVCSAEVVVVREYEPLPQILSLLMRTSFAGYPVVDRSNHLTGLVTRTQLASMVERAKEESETAAGVGELIKVLPLCDTPPEITLWNTPVVRCFHHFRASGLQHLCVVSETQELLGILTRTDFSRLCHHGPESIDHVRVLLERKKTYVAEQAEQQEADSESPSLTSDPWRRSEQRIPTSSTAYSNTDYSGVSSSGEDNKPPSSHGNSSAESSPPGSDSRHEALAARQIT